MSRDVEVLREMLRVTQRRLGGLLLTGSKQIYEAEATALTAAIAALEAEGALKQRVEELEGKIGLASRADAEGAQVTTPPDHKPITEAELKKMGTCALEGDADTDDILAQHARRIAEVCRLRDIITRMDTHRPGYVCAICHNAEQHADWCPVPTAIVLPHERKL